MRESEPLGYIDLKMDIAGKISQELPKSIGSKDDMQKWLEGNDFDAMMDGIIELIDAHIDNAIEAFKNNLFEEN